MKGSPADPNRICASQVTDWFGQVLPRSDDGGKTWEPVGNEFLYAGEPGTHQWYDGTPHPWEFKRVWHLEPSPKDPDEVYAGVEDAALFRSVDGGKSWQELDGLRGHSSGNQWTPGAGGLCLHTILLDPAPGKRILGAISAAAAFRSDDGGDSWHEVSGDLPTDFGFPIEIHAHEPDTVYVVPIKSDSEHYPPEGKLRVYRSRTGGNEWEPLTKGLPQKDGYVNILRDALEGEHPVLRGTTRDPAPGRRRPFLRFFAAGLDLSHEEPDDPVPPEVARGEEPFLVVGSVAGG